MKLQQRAKTLRQKINKEMYPFLTSNSKDVKDAKNMCLGLSIALRQKQMEIMAEMKPTDLDVISFFKEETQEKYSSFLSIFNDLTCKDTLELLDGFQQEVNRWIEIENESKPLKEIKHDLLDYDE